MTHTIYSTNNSALLTQIIAATYDENIASFQIKDAPSAPTAYSASLGRLISFLSFIRAIFHTEEEKRAQREKEEQESQKINQETRQKFYAACIDTFKLKNENYLIDKTNLEEIAQELKYKLYESNAIEEHDEKTITIDFDINEKDPLLTKHPAQFMQVLYASVHKRYNADNTEQVATNKAPTADDYLQMDNDSAKNRPTNSSIEAEK